VFGITPCLPYPQGEEPVVLSGQESGSALELVLESAQKRKILACDTVWIGIKIPPFGEACFLHMPPYVCCLE
jgi:hypothetical protein